MSSVRPACRCGCCPAGARCAGPAASVGGRGSLFLVERHALVYRHTWLVFVSGVVEPLFYLLSIGVGLGKLVGPVQGPAARSATPPSWPPPCWPAPR